MSLNQHKWTPSELKCVHRAVDGIEKGETLYSVIKALTKFRGVLSHRSWDAVKNQIYKERQHRKAVDARYR